jgi:uncharacterized protein
MGLFESLGLGASWADGRPARAPDLPPPEKIFEGPALDLLKAALAGNEAGMRDAISQGASPNAQGPRSTSKATPQLTLLHYAVGVRNERALGLLVSLGADPLREPRPEDGSALSFPIVRGDAAMLDAFLRLWPLSKVPEKQQSEMASSTIPFKCRPCLEVMFKRGLPPGITDSVKYNLFMEALSFNDLDMAEWLLIEVGVPLSAQTVRGVNSANYVQAELARYKPGSAIHARYLKFKTFMEGKGVVFPVETAAEWRARNGVK